MKKEKMEDLLITALEGGSNYWYLLGSLSMTEQYRENEQSDSERIFKAAMAGKSIPVFDVEFPEEKLGEISMVNMRRASRLMKENHPEHYKYVMDDSWDAETADVWFQLAVIGELTFG